MKSIHDLFDLRSKVAVITGGAMGIGKAITMRLAGAGAKVLIADLDIDAAKKTVDEIRKLKGEAEAFQTDTSKAQSAEKVIEKTLSLFGDIHIMVNNAGIYRYLPAVQMTEEMWDLTLNINLKGVMFFAKAAANAMIAKKHGGKIINIASIDGFKPSGNLTHYDASKGGVVMLTKALAKELGPMGIHVNAIAPGGINTPGTAKMAEASGMTQEQMAAIFKEFVKNIPLQRMGEPDDIGKVALFLASEAADYMTGHVVVVDGGALVA